MTGVLESLHRDHVNLSRLLDALERQIDAFDTGEAPDYDIVRGVIDYCVNYPDLYHHPKEDLIFQRLSRRDPAACGQVGDLEAEHRALRELTGQFADALHNVLRDAEVPREAFDTVARRFLDHYRQHMSMEEQVFLPAAEAALTAADWDEIESRIARRDDPVFGAEGEERFRVLRQEILDWAQETG